MVTTTRLRVGVALFLFSVLLVTFTFAQEVAPFSGSALVKLGDKIRYGSYSICKIGEGIYKINDRDAHQEDARMGGLGSDMYLICGEKRALMIDLGNNYITGYAGDNLRPRKNAAEEFRAMVFGLVGKLPLEVSLTHMHPDHDGMTGALINRGVTLWVSDGEDLTGLTKQHNLDPSVYTVFTPGKKSFDLGGGRVVNTLLVRGHSNGGTTYILNKDGLVFIGDAWGVGWGLSVHTADQIKVFAEDSRKVVDYIFANFSPYERYALKVYPGHTRYMGTGPVRTEKIPYFDAGYFDWRFLQDMASSANGILKGLWLEEGRGLSFVETPEIVNNPSAPKGERVGYMVYGTGSVITPLKAAYDAADLKMPQ